MIENESPKLFGMDFRINAALPDDKIAFVPSDPHREPPPSASEYALIENVAVSKTKVDDLLDYRLDYTPDYAAAEMRALLKIQDEHDAAYMDAIYGTSGKATTRAAVQEDTLTVAKLLKQIEEFEQRLFDQDVTFLMAMLDAGIRVRLNGIVLDEHSTEMVLVVPAKKEKALREAQRKRVERAPITNPWWNV